MIDFDGVPRPYSRSFQGHLLLRVSQKIQAIQTKPKTNNAKPTRKRKTPNKTMKLINSSTLFTTLLCATAIGTAFSSSSKSSKSSDDYDAECELHNYKFSLDAHPGVFLDDSDESHDGFGTKCDINVFFCDEKYKNCIQKYYNGIAVGTNSISACTTVDVEVIAVTTHCEDLVVGSGKRQIL